MSDERQAEGHAHASYDHLPNIAMRLQPENDKDVHRDVHDRLVCSLASAFVLSTIASAASAVPSAQRLAVVGR
jgi:hypothetical protein